MNWVQVVGDECEEVEGAKIIEGILYHSNPKLGFNTEQKTL